MIRKRTIRKKSGRGLLTEKIEDDMHSFVTNVNHPENLDNTKPKPISVFKAPLMNLRQLENKVFKNSTGFKKPGRIFF